MRGNKILAFVPAFILCLAHPAPGQSDSGQVLAWLPGKDWEVAVDLKGFQIQSNNLTPDGGRYLMASKEGYGFSVALEKTGEAASLEGCRDHLNRKAKDPSLPKEQVKLWDDARGIWLEYIIPTVDGVPLRQKNMFLCTTKEDVYVDVHFSKVQFEAGQEAEFATVLESLRIQGSTRSENLNEFMEGTKLYLAEKYHEAIKHYQKALDLEKKEPKLDKTTWRVLIDNLGMAYGVTGDLTRAKEVFDYGLSQDPSYPLFHYNLACTWAEMNDPQRAMESLKTAFQFRENVIAGEKMPDPRKDPSFKRLMKNKEFRALVDQLVSLK